MLIIILVKMVWMIMMILNDNDDYNNDIDNDDYNNDDYNNDIYNNDYNDDIEW